VCSWYKCDKIFKEVGIVCAGYDAHQDANFAHDCSIFRVVWCSRLPIYTSTASLYIHWKSHQERDHSIKSICLPSKPLEFWTKVETCRTCPIRLTGKKRCGLLYYIDCNSAFDIDFGINARSDFLCSLGESFHFPYLCEVSKIGNIPQRYLLPTCFEYLPKTGSKKGTAPITFSTIQ
jgi:hypothetical protein